MASSVSRLSVKKRLVPSLRLVAVLPRSLFCLPQLPRSLWAMLLSIISLSFSQQMPQTTRVQLWKPPWTCVAKKLCGSMLTSGEATPSLTIPFALCCVSLVNMTKTSRLRFCLSMKAHGKPPSCILTLLRFAGELGRLPMRWMTWVLYVRQTSTCRSQDTMTSPRSGCLSGSSTWSRRRGSRASSLSLLARASHRQHTPQSGHTVSRLGLTGNTRRLCTVTSLPSDPWWFWG